MRPLWKGAIAFGLVNVPIRVYSATESHDITLHMVHSADGGRIRYQRRCEACGRIVDNEDIDRAHIADGRTVILTEDELAELPADRDREMDVIEFVPNEQVDVLRLDKSYFLEPEQKAVKAYTLLRQALEATDRVAIVQFAMRKKTRMGALRVHGNALVVQTLLWDDEVREPKFDVLDTTTDVSKRELDMAKNLVESLSDDFDEDAFGDEYQKQLRELIDAKLDSDTAAPTTSQQSDEEAGGEVIDLMDALQQSVDRRNKSKGSKTRSSSKSSSSKSSSSKNTSQKKTSQKKASQKKSSGKSA